MTRHSLSASLLITLAFVSIGVHAVAAEVMPTSSLAKTTALIGVPKLATPAWLAAASPSSPAPQPTPATATKRIVTYLIKTEGVVTTSVTEFRQKANQTLNDSRGWARLGVQFQEVASGAQFSLILSQAENIPNYSPTGCSTELSCTVGNNVLINQTRWLNATTTWNQAGGSLDAYRSMVINHEVGHWLGHGHVDCPGAGQAAPIMRQQSVDLGGCTPNPWPLASELYSSRLGI